jgi:hypothetical protein
VKTPCLAGCFFIDGDSNQSSHHYLIVYMPWSLVAGDSKLTDEWSAEAKFGVVLETAELSEIELS